MDNIESLRFIIESLEDHMAAEDSSHVPDSTSDDENDVQELPQEEVAVNPMDSFISIMSSIKVLTSSLQNGENVQEITSGLRNIASDFEELCSSLTQIDENYGADGMEPKLVKDGGAELQIYSDPNGTSYPARKGFVG